MDKFEIKPELDLGGPNEMLGILDENSQDDDPLNTSDDVKLAFNSNGGLFYRLVTVDNNDLESAQTSTSNSSPTQCQFYVIKNSPTDFATTLTQRPVSAKQETPTKSIPPTKTKRDERRRANHNEIERRRRDKINNWITQLNSRIPETFIDSNRMLGSSATDNLSKGGILAKACEYITYLEDLAKSETDAKLVAENEALKKENAKLKQLLSEHGIKGET